MPALDPFSGSSRPFFSFDSSPSKPLPFAASFVEDVGQPARLPKPRKHDEAIPKFPEPQYTHSRTISAASIHGALDEHPAASRVELGSDEWMQRKVAECVDSASGVLDLKDLGLTSLSTRISELQNLVTLPTSYSPQISASPRPPVSPNPNGSLAHLSPGSGHLAANARSFSRHVSAPASSSAFSTFTSQPVPRIPSGLGVGGILLSSPTLTEASDEGENPSTRNLRRLPDAAALYPASASRRALGRSKTGANSLNTGTQPAKDLEILLAQNRLTSLPTALFEISNLTMLSLRGNELTSLPAAVGRLRNLKELNISNNRITVLPSSLANLSLATFWAHPNPFLPRPTRAASASDRIFSPIVSNGISRLSSLCIRALLSPRPPSHLPALLDGYTWDPPAKGQPHPLLDAKALHTVLPHVSEQDCRRILQALRSAFQSAQSTRSRSDQSHFFPRSHLIPPPDDASLNPYFSPCPSPRHLELDAISRPNRSVFLYSAEERIEWMELFGQGRLPVLWQGCTPGCLNFLTEEDEWEIDE